MGSLISPLSANGDSGFPSSAAQPPFFSYTQLRRRTSLQEFCGVCLLLRPLSIEKPQPSSARSIDLGRNCALIHVYVCVGGGRKDSTPLFLRSFVTPGLIRELRACDRRRLFAEHAIMSIATHFRMPSAASAPSWVGTGEGVEALLLPSRSTHEADSSHGPALAGIDTY